VERLRLHLDESLQGQLQCLAQLPSGEARLVQRACRGRALTARRWSACRAFA
jgi:hypothetical protein